MHRKTEYSLTWVLRCDAIGCAVAVDDAFTQRGQAEIVLLDSANLHTLVNYIRFYLVLYSLYSVHAPFGCCCEIQLSEKYANLKLRRKFFLKIFKLLGICHAGLLCSCWCVRRKSMRQTQRGAQQCIISQDAAQEQTQRLYGPFARPLHVVCVLRRSWPNVSEAECLE